MWERLLFSVAISILVLQGFQLHLFADEPGPGLNKALQKGQSSQAKEQGSENYGKSDKFLPGEEVVSPTGQKMKVWSTEGPVKVTAPPEPFTRPEDRYLNNPNIIVDTEVLKHDGRNAASGAPSSSASSGAAPRQRNELQRQERFSYPERSGDGRKERED